MTKNEDLAYLRLPKRFREHPRAYDIWQAYTLLASYAQDRWRCGWSFGFPASLSFPEWEIDSLHLGAFEDCPNPQPAGMDTSGSFSLNREMLEKDLFSRSAYMPPDGSADSLRQGGGRLRLDVTLPGILGPGGPMPLLFCERVIQERHNGNRSLQDFLDLFQNHLMQLWMKDAAVMCPELGPIKRDADDLPAVCGLAMAGLLTGGMQDNPRIIALSHPPWKTEQSLPAASFTDAAFLWASYPPSATGLEMLLEKCLGIKAEVEQFRGAWRDMPPSCRTRLGGTNSRLGSDAIVGKAVFDPCEGIALRITNPLSTSASSYLPVACLDKGARMQNAANDKTVSMSPRGLSFASAKKLTTDISVLVEAYTNIVQISILYILTA